MKDFAHANANAAAQEDPLADATAQASSALEPQNPALLLAQSIPCCLTQDVAQELLMTAVKLLAKASAAASASANDQALT
jgi:hypothetical protein